jgi:hypothetical protein
MRLRLSAAAFAVMTGITLTSAQAADASYPPPHHAHPHPRAYPRAYLPPPPPAPRFGWVLMPGLAYAPIAPQDFSLATGEYWSRLWEPYPYCCPDPYYAPAVFP